MLITEALAEIKTIEKRIANKHEQILGVLWRQNRLKDPYEKEGGSELFVASQLQAMQDLHQRRVELRQAINSANRSNGLTIDGMWRTVEEWLIWRREVAPAWRAQLLKLRQTIAKVRTESAQKSVSVVSAVAIANADAMDANTVFINIDEAQLNSSLEHIETVLGTLDGALSVFNATTNVGQEVDDLVF